MLCILRGCFKLVICDFMHQYIFIFFMLCEQYFSYFDDENSHGGIFDRDKDEMGTIGRF